MSSSRTSDNTNKETTETVSTNSTDSSSISDLFSDDQRLLSADEIANENSSFEVTQEQEDGISHEPVTPTEE